MTKQIPESGSGTVTATIGNGYAYPNYSGTPRFFAHGNKKVVLHSVQAVDKLGTQTGLNLTLQDDLKPGMYLFGSAGSPEPPVVWNRTDVDQDNDWRGLTYLSDPSSGHIDITEFSLTSGILKATFAIEFKAYEGQPVYTASGEINVAGLVEDK
ncbi:MULTISPECIES: hypothetical protein [Pseudomonas]|uniref:hypothetical protein n=1 Tax=Pseudomonas TaxID=286 RepID=UPI00026FDAF7|nr:MULTISPECIES: hypothetical protein [Pseudomonas]EJM25815.1 hypothetical protein PMI24_04163 [Pseudomonas sp. GM25]MCU0089209.1 hypothetical protein [Pseudomonas koreensis]